MLMPEDSRDVTEEGKTAGVFLFFSLSACTIESILIGNITVWDGNRTKQDHKVLQRVVCLAQCTIGGASPCLKHIHTKRCRA